MSIVDAAWIHVRDADLACVPSSAVSTVVATVAVSAPMVMAIGVGVLPVGVSSVAVSLVSIGYVLLPGLYGAVTILDAAYVSVALARAGGPSASAPYVACDDLGMTCVALAPCIAVIRLAVPSVALGVGVVPVWTNLASDSRSMLPGTSTLSKTSPSTVPSTIV